MKPFWQMFWANTLWFLVTLAISVPISIVFALRKRKKIMAMQLEVKPRKLVILDGDHPESGRCPLCGQAWLMSGPVYPAKHDAP